jgi:hypothetical protein
MVVLLKGNIDDNEYESAKKIKDVFESDDSLKNAPNQIRLHDRPSVP